MRVMVGRSGRPDGEWELYNEFSVPYCFDEKRAETKGKALDLPVNRFSYSHLWQWNAVHVMTNRPISRTPTHAVKFVTGFTQDGGCHLPYGQ